MTVASIFIEPHERYEAAEAYASWLTPAQIEEIKDAPDGALINLLRSPAGTTLTIIPEG